MIFEPYENNYKSSNNKFIRIHNVVLGSISTNVIDNNKEVPYTSSSSAKNTGTCLMKMYSENVERTKIGFNYKKEHLVYGINIIDNNIIKIKRKFLSYGYNPLMGFVDTTGTASGNVNSKIIIEKSIAELIEKNELFLFWYCGMGKELKNSSIKKIIVQYGMSMYENKFFLAKNLCNWPTVICITIKDGLIVSTGICCHKNFISAVKGALSESKILKSLNSFKRNNVYKFSEQKNQQIFKKLNSYGNKKNNNIMGLKNHIYSYNLSLPSWINDLNISLLNISKNDIEKAISSYSTSLLKCVPNKSNLKFCLDVPIIKKFKKEIIEHDIDCFIG